MVEKCSGPLVRVHDDDEDDDDNNGLSFSPNFYILDEPTNHLDMETIEALAKALNKFKVCCFLCLFCSLTTKYFDC